MSPALLALCPPPLHALHLLPALRCTGPARFALINNTARSLLEETGHVKAAPKKILRGSAAAKAAEDAAAAAVDKRKGGGGRLKR